MSREVAILRALFVSGMWLTGRMLRKNANRLLPWWRWMDYGSFYIAMRDLYAAGLVRRVEETRDGKRVLRFKWRDRGEGA